jgi:hypothetical protein
MKRLILATVLCSASPAFAEGGDAGKQEWESSKPR